MTEETRRSGRATKGQHTKDREVNEAPAASKKKGTAKKANKKAAEEEEEEEPEEKIRCVCGEYEEETDIPRAMICCDNCEAWQHNDCMGLAEDYAPDSYFCEECKPENHKALLAAMKKGQKPWEQAAKKRAALIEAEKAAKGKKGKKGGRKSAAADEEAEPPSATPTTGQKRKAEESPAPSETKTATKKAKSTPQPTPSAEPTTARGRKAATSTPVPASPSPAPPKDPKELPQSRQGPATGLVKLFTEQTKAAVKDGFVLPSNQNVNIYGAHLGMAVEAAIYQHSTTTSNESDTYKNQLQAILLNVKRNNVLAARVVRAEVSPDQLAAMPPAAMVSEEQQRKDAEMQAQLDKQSTLVGHEEQGPRVRRTHKGEEYVEDLNKPSAETTEAKPATPRQPSTAGVKSPTHSRRPPSVTIPNRRPSTDPRRQSSGNFDLNSVYSNVQGSPVGDQRFGEITQPSREPVGPGARPDADIDNLLKDEEEAVSSPPYSPRADSDDAVWRGLINGGNVGRFHNGFKFAAGAPIDAPTLRLTWEQLLPSEIGISGRIDPKKAEDYLCGLEFSNTSDLIVLWMGAPVSSSEASQFSLFFEYFKSRDRYGVGSQNHNPALKDIYFIPLEKGQQMPLFLSNLHTEFPNEAAERMILIPLVIKNSELPRNVAESPAAGGGVMQTPITPRENWQVDGTTNGGPPGSGFTAYASSTPAAVNGNTGGVPPYPQSQQQGHQQNSSTPSQPQPTAQSNQVSQPQPQQTSPPAYQPLPATATPAQQAAHRILGPQLSLAPAVQQLCQTAPTAGEQEMNVVKDCIAENPQAANNLEVLTQMLTRKWQEQAGQASGGAQAGQVRNDGTQVQAQGQDSHAAPAASAAATDGPNGAAGGS